MVFFLGNSNLHFFQELALGGKTWFIVEHVAIPVGLRDLFPSRMDSSFSTGTKGKKHGIEGSTKSEPTT